MQQPVADQSFLKPQPSESAEDQVRAEKYHSLKKNPDLVFGSASEWIFNTRDGGEPGSEINLHNDEPINMGEANMDDSSESGSDGEETEEDVAAYKEALKRADKNVQVKKHSKRMKKRAFLQTQSEFVPAENKMSTEDTEDQFNEIFGPSMKANSFSRELSKLQSLTQEDDPAASPETPQHEVDPESLKTED
mmetsp:Transcript_22975/g.35463  ORF Transcript_22975/g.35463 Transcript_22975/m.35463 type:complete len:192 (+) Transcript_22975:72-647(+)